MKSRFARAPRFSSSWATLDAPTSVEATVGLAKHPGQCELRQRLAAGFGDPSQPAKPVENLLGHAVVVECGPARRAFDFTRGLLQVAIRQQPLGQGGERDRAHAGVGELSGEPVLDPPIEQRVRRLMNHEGCSETAARSSPLRWSWLPSTTRCRHSGSCPRARRCPGRRSSPPAVCRVDAVGVEDVDVVETEAVEGFVEAGEKLLTAAELTVGPGHMSHPALSR